MDRFRIVAVASYAGDIEAVSELLSALPAACGAAFVIVQHLESARKMWLGGALAQRTILPVIDAHDGIVPERAYVYVARTNATLTISDGRIRTAPGENALHHPGDALFTSLAEEYGDNAISVVLSGGGSDGALGTQAIRKAGGTTFAQYPGSARFPSMPINAIETGCVGYVLRPNEIAHELVRLTCNSVPPRSAAHRVPLAVGG